ncbi:MAG: HEPN domain-containing protein [Burkholderiaceae bacterium]|nr:HEPN domain-containing protein [Microbacteriaceae bacterium]
MIRRWEKGRPAIDALLSERRLERVSPDRKLADVYLEEARRHLTSSQLMTDSDPTGSFQLAYDGARKALVAMLINQGLRPTSTGGHRVVEDALRAQLTPPKNEIVDGFGWMRGLRNASEYPSFDRPSAASEDAAEAQALTATIIEKSKELVDLMPVY